MPSLCGDAVGGGAGRHRARDALEALGVARRQRRVGGEHGERVRGRDELAAADDEIAVAVAVASRAEIRAVRRHHDVVELLRVGEVRVGVVAAEIGQRRPVDHRARRRAEFALQDRLRVGAGDGVHGVELHAEAAGEQRADRRRSRTACASAWRSCRPDRRSRPSRRRPSSRRACRDRRPAYRASCIG